LQSGCDLITVYTYSNGANEIRILDTPRLHRQRKGRRKTVKVMDDHELATHFQVAQDQLKPTLIAAGWQFHEDANGRLWSVPPEAAREPDR